MYLIAPLTGLFINNSLSFQVGSVFDKTNIGIILVLNTPAVFNVSLNLVDN